MVSKPTVLIVGAGGSIPYGYPSGRALVDEIISGLESVLANRSSFFSSLAGDYPPSILDGFRNALLLSGRDSIDAFLEKNSKYLDVGKAMIASALVPYEKPLVRPASGKGDWYRYLFNRLAQNRDAGMKERLVILTFNYDLSLEHYLYEAFRHSDSDNPLDLQEVFSQLEIIHLHGSLCSLPWQASHSAPCRVYGKDNSSSHVKRAANCIKIIHEHKDDDEGFKRARAALEKAYRVCFLGFGYHPTNIRRLIKDTIWNQTKGTGCILGSCYGLTEAEVNEAKNLLHQYPRFAGRHDDCLTVLREHLHFIS